MRLSSLPPYEYADVKIVKYACNTFNINYKKYVAMEDKLRIKDHTGLSLSLICRALTNLRKLVDF